MSEDRFWYGYLEAGDKSSPVLLDNKLSTGDPRTVYIYNLKRGRILEYSREIVDAKLRDLKPEEASLVDEIKSGYAQAKSGFRARGATRHAVPERGEQVNAQGEEELAEAGVSGGDDWDEEEDDES